MHPTVMMPVWLQILMAIVLLGGAYVVVDGIIIIRGVRRELKKLREADDSARYRDIEGGV